MRSYTIACCLLCILLIASAGCVQPGSKPDTKTSQETGKPNTVVTRQTLSFDNDISQLEKETLIPPAPTPTMRKNITFFGGSSRTITATNLTGSSSNSTTTNVTGNTTNVQSVSFHGEILIAGSTDNIPITQNAATQYMVAHPGINIIVQEGGWGAVVASAAMGVTDIGISSRELTITEIASYPDLFVTHLTYWDTTHPASVSLYIITKDKPTGVVGDFINYFINYINATTVAPTPTSPVQTQTIKVSGSTTVLPIAQKAAETYMKAHPNADIQISGGGSSIGVQQIGEKTVDIGMSSRELSSTEVMKYSSLVKNVIAKDGIAIIVNPANEIQSISASAVADVYTGKITKWTELLGGNVPNTNNVIVVVGRDSASGTRTFFDSDATGFLHGAAPVKTMLEKNSNGAVAQTVAQTPSAIGYVLIGFISNDVKALPIWYNDPNKPIQPTIENVRTKTYPINRELFMFTNSQPKGLAKDYIDFIISPDGQKIVSDEGYVTLS